jgi:hypothetical protein
VRRCSFRCEAAASAALLVLVRCGSVDHAGERCSFGLPKRERHERREQAADEGAERANAGPTGCGSSWPAAARPSCSSWRSRYSAAARQSALPRAHTGRASRRRSLGALSHVAPHLRGDAHRRRRQPASPPALDRPSLRRVHPRYLRPPAPRRSRPASRLGLENPMTDGRPRRSSMYVAEQQAAPDLEKPRHSTFPTGADGST